MSEKMPVEFALVLAHKTSLFCGTLLNQLQRETSIKSSIRMKRYRAAMDNQYAAKVLFA